MKIFPIFHVSCSAFVFLVVLASCHAWGYQHPAALRLPTEKPTGTSTFLPTESSTQSSSPLPSITPTTPSTNPASIGLSSTEPTITTEAVIATSPFVPSPTTEAFSKRPTLSTTKVPTTTTTASKTSENETTKTTTQTETSRQEVDMELTSTQTTTTSQHNSKPTEKEVKGPFISTTPQPPLPLLRSYLLSTKASPQGKLPSETAESESTSSTDSSKAKVIPTSSSSSSAPELKVVSTTFSKTESSPNSNLMKACTRNSSEVRYWDFGYCTQNCTTNEDCNTKENEECVCDGPCGMSCVTPDLVSIYCNAPGEIENGKSLLEGELGLYNYRNQLQRFMHNQRVLFECDEGFTLIDGPREKICRNGLWFPAVDQPKCVYSNTPGFRWMQSTRVKRRAIKSGGSGSLARSRVTGGRGGRGDGGGRRGRKQQRGPGEEDGNDDGGSQDGKEDSALCMDLVEEHDENLVIELITKGNDPNNTDVSEGAVIRVSCTHGYGVNLPNDTITCDERGRWRPKNPHCNPLPCKVPYIPHSTFYIGGKALFFLELKNHETNIELRCSKGYILNGPSRFHCSYGEWDLVDAPECIPASCDLPVIEHGGYGSRYKPGQIIAHDTEVDYHCKDEYQKMAPGGPAKCHLGEWRPNKPACFHPSYIHGLKNFTHDKDNRIITSIKRACGLPPREKGAIYYTEGKPIDYDTDYIFPSGTEVMYRCFAVKPKLKYRWKMICEDGQWMGGLQNLTCELSTNYSQSTNLTSIKDTLEMINSTCTYNSKEDTHVVTFFNDKELTMDTKEFPPQSVLLNRCIDIGKFKMTGALRRRCISGQWIGITPKCEGLSQYHDYVVDKPPTILFRYLNGSIVQTNDGKLMVYPGTTLHMECLYIRRFGKPLWNVSNQHKTYPEGWTDGIENRDPSLEYRLTIEEASEEDTGSFSCVTPSRHGHQVDIVVKKVDCPPLPQKPDLIYSTDATMLGTKVTFQCKDSNTLIGASDVVCQATGTWSAPLPKCENVECPDISMVPAMAPLDYSSMSRNGSLKRNETAPPKITIMNREVGGKAIFSCPQGFMTEGSPEAVCQMSGQWSAPVPICKEVECPSPPSPQNGFVTGNAPYKAGDLAQFECQSGFMMEGQPIIACQDNGKWSRSSSATKCVKACTYPGTTIGGTISAVKFYYPVGETVEFDCTEGYELQGSRMLHCLDTVKWSTSIPSCVLIKERNKK